MRGINPQKDVIKTRLAAKLIMNARLLCNKANDNLVNKERETNTTTFFVFSDKEEDDEEHILVLLLGDTKS
jgi:hypothetical protein